MKGYENIVRVIEHHIGFQFERNKQLFEQIQHLEADLKKITEECNIYKQELVNISREYQKDREKWADLEKNQ